MTYSDIISDALVEIREILKEMRDYEVITKGDKIIYAGMTYFYIENNSTHHIVGNKFLRPKLHIPISEEDNIYKVTGMTDEAIRNFIKIYGEME